MKEPLLMNRMRVILTVLLIGVAFGIGYFLIAPAQAPSKPVTVSFLGFTNALPFVGAPEVGRSQHAAFQVTNHLAKTMTYYCEAQGSQTRGKGSWVYASYELPANGTDTFTLPTAAGTNAWTFVVVTSSSRPRPAWQQRIREYSKWLGGPQVFVGPARNYPQFTNIWMTPEL